MEKKKTVIIINGTGGAGKDTLCDMAAKHWGASSVSYADPLKECAACCGYTGEKTDAWRESLSQLDTLLTKYGMPLAYIWQKVLEFVEDGQKDVLFIHCRRPANIEAIKEKIAGSNHGFLHTYTLLVQPHPGAQRAFSNESDASVYKYSYDFTYNNVQPLHSMEQDVVRFLTPILGEPGPDTLPDPATEGE